ncbi:transmembrane protein 11-A, mitochondrial-like [Tubulanus polymorphus]|uniref:transmembrane protein 11-A, mitochondrial-like n=1 Tax=Tubulanus polymorphus TaxID=672921 RepID=UPI003DA1F7AD
MAVATDRDDVKNYVIIHEIYEHEDAHIEFENELERALEAEVETIIIEPTKLGDETAKWITVGNCLHKTAVLAGLSSFIVAAALPTASFGYIPLGCTSVVCSSVYAISWQFDPCCKYQVEYNPKKLQKLPLHNLGSSSPVVLVRKNDRRRKILHNSISLAAGAFCIWKFYSWYSN